MKTGFNGDITSLTEYNTNRTKPTAKLVDFQLIESTGSVQF